MRAMDQPRSGSGAGYRDHKQKPRRIAGVSDRQEPNLFNFGFFVDYVLARNGVILLHFQLVGHGPLILISSVEVTCTRR